MKKAVIAIIILVLAMSIALPIYANPKDPADYNGLEKGKSAVMHLYLYEKDPSDWSIIEDGAWGKLTFNTDKDTFVFNGHMLQACTGYTLVRYWEAWPAVEIIGCGMTDECGDINIKGDFGNWADKIWLVKSSDLTGSNFNSWNPTEYLFEYDKLG